MEFFRGVDIDWMGKTKYFVTLSLALLAIGWFSVYREKGLMYGIDFRGGTLVYVRFSNAPPIDQIRKGLADAGLTNSTIQGINDLSNPNSKNDVVIGLEQKGQGDEALDVGKQAILSVLHKIFGTDIGGKQDFNSITPSALSAYLTRRDPLVLGTSAGDRYSQLAQRFASARDKNQGGIVTNFDQLRNVEGATPVVLASLRDGFALGNFAIRDVEIVGPKVGAQLRRQAILATLYALAGMLVYIAL